MHAANLYRSQHRLGVIVEFNHNTGINVLDLLQTIAYALACDYPACEENIASKLKSRTLGLANATSRDIFNNSSQDLCDNLLHLAVTFHATDFP